MQPIKLWLSQLRVSMDYDLAEPGPATSQTRSDGRRNLHLTIQMPLPFSSLNFFVLGIQSNAQG